mmetsp:Transcript_21739/g.53640  ORF Transcript_21739/g.53640 Transcript_21739/m.53640 type:complete len:288 (-) Transcript_21739:535-1398(-)
MNRPCDFNVTSFKMIPAISLLGPLRGVHRRIRINRVRGCEEQPHISRDVPSITGSALVSTHRPNSIRASQLLITWVLVLRRLHQIRNAAMRRAIVSRPLRGIFRAIDRSRLARNRRGRVLFRIHAPTRPIRPVLHPATHRIHRGAHIPNHVLRGIRGRARKRLHPIGQPHHRGPVGRGDAVHFPAVGPGAVAEIAPFVAEDVGAGMEGDHEAVKRGEEELVDDAGRHGGHARGWRLVKGEVAVDVDFVVVFANLFADIVVVPVRVRHRNQGDEAGVDKVAHPRGLVV